MAAMWTSTANKKERSGHFFQESLKRETFSFFDDGAYAALVSYTSRKPGHPPVGTVACVLIVKGRWELNGEVVRITRSAAEVSAEKYTENGRTLDRSKVKMRCSALFSALKGSTSEFSVVKPGPDWVEVTSKGSGKSERWTKTEFTM
jgi:hypothetical protein